ncbi:unnamed protein product [Ectocarpus sp. CCAP 1310/34]|nr:unnamed protein product [Ectocarpus sp. CCAP 1310/34]
MAGASIEVLDRDFRTPLVVANRDISMRSLGSRPRKEKPAAIVALLKHGANANLKLLGDPLLLRAAYFISVPAAEALLAAGAEVNIFSDHVKNFTPQHVPTKYDHPGVLTAALPNAVDTEIRRIHGWTPLHEAAERGHVNSIDALVDRGAKVDVQDLRGCTPLHIACKKLKCSAIHTLLRSGADIQALDNSQYSPLHCPVCRIKHRYSVCDLAHSVNLLLRWGADDNVVNSYGKTVGEVLQGYSANLSRFRNSMLVRLLLSKAPQDKAWRRRGWLVLCRTRPSRVWLKSKHEGASSRRSTRNVRARDVGVWARFDAGATPQQGAAGGIMAPTESDATAGGLHVRKLGI